MPAPASKFASCADEMSMKRWSTRVKDSFHLWEMEMKILL